VLHVLIPCMKTEDVMNWGYKASGTYAIIAMESLLKRGKYQIAHELFATYPDIVGPSLNDIMLRLGGGIPDTFTYVEEWDA
jgi:hypothetical protein